MRLAAIDIGSNAARLLISEVDVSPDGEISHNKLNLTRIPLRLGFDVFTKGHISAKKTAMLMQTIRTYKDLMEVYGVRKYIACATSAMRDATNGKSIISQVKKETGVGIKIISGKKEGALINENRIPAQVKKNRDYLYIDVGGGSTELTYYSKSKCVFNESFNIGTIRLLKNQITDECWYDMKDMIKSQIDQNRLCVAIGSGGNINKLFSLSKRKEGKPLSFSLLKDYYKEFSFLTVEERMELYNLRSDRADVIVPALQIYLNVMKWAGTEKIFVPKIGLVDGLVRHLYQSEIQKTSRKLSR